MLLVFVNGNRKLIFDILKLFYSSVQNNNGLTNGSVTWLQRQQQKLRERKEAALRMERRPQEVRLISELKSQYNNHHHHHHQRPSASHRDGYTSDTTHFADDDDDDDDLSIPLHVQTSPHRNLGSAPVSPLPRRILQNGVVERPFVQVKRTQETRKYAIDSVSFFFFCFVLIHFPRALCYYYYYSFF